MKRLLPTKTICSCFVAMDKRDRLAVLAALSYAARALVWSAFVGMTWKVALPIMLAVPSLFMALSVFYRLVREDPEIARLLLYSALWLGFPVFGAQITYLSARADFPMQDHLFAAMDQAIGFDWTSWARFFILRPWLADAAGLVYASYYVQPFLAVIVLHRIGQGSENANYFLAMIIALTVEIVISTALPAIGPARAEGIVYDSMKVMARLRSGELEDFPYVGIIAFPSFHTAMAVLSALVYRRMKPFFVMAIVWNVLMLFTIPYPGNHYLVDILAGILIAIGAHMVAVGFNERVCGKRGVDLSTGAQAAEPTYKPTG